MEELIRIELPGADPGSDSRIRLVVSQRALKDSWIEASSCNDDSCVTEFVLENASRGQPPHWSLKRQLRI